MTDAIDLMKFINDHEGVTAVEYAIIAGVICVSLGAGFTAFANELSTFLGALTL